MYQQDIVKEKLHSLPQVKFSTRTIPLALVLILMAAFGTLIPALGFYQDDWHPVYYGYARGLASLSELFAYDGRPFAALIYQIGFPLIGFKPLNWQLLALSLRALTVIFTWASLTDIWPDHKREIAWTALLFAVYPLFKLQALSLIYAIHWTGYLLFSISIWAMVRSLRHPPRFWPYALLSVITAALHLLILEYFAGVELIRPVIIYLLLREQEDSLNAQLRRVLQQWSPYLVILISFGIYRLFFLPGPERGSVSNQPTLLMDLFNSPVTAGPRLVQLALQDTIAILYSVWHTIINPDLLAFSVPANLKALLIAFAIAAAAFIYLANLQSKPSPVDKSLPAWSRDALLLGLIITVLGPIPAWITDQAITTDNPLWSDRFGLASMIGASLLVVALLELLVTNRHARVAILSILLGFSVGWHVLNTNEYRHSWIKQSDFYWQLRWRAPYIEPSTALLSSSEIFPRMGEYPTSFALSTLYPEHEDNRELNYYFYSLSSHFDTQREDLIQGMRLRRVAYSSIFTGSSQDSLVISYDPERYECLWVLRPEDTNLRALPEISREVAVISSLDRIHANASLSQHVPTQIFGNEPPHTWCYHYQKADLARQLQDWNLVVSLWDQAEANGFGPGNGVEYLPFIDGFARTGDWKTAEAMTFAANEDARVMAPILCPTWQQIEQETRPSPERDQTLENIYNQLCASPG
jgi:hypothetical protein